MFLNKGTPFNIKGNHAALLQTNGHVHLKSLSQLHSYTGTTLLILAKIGKPNLKKLGKKIRLGKACDAHHDQIWISESLIIYDKNHQE